MIPITREERRWFLRNLGRGMVDFLGTTDPPVPVEELLSHPPGLYTDDFGVVEMFSTLWDATFARPPGRRGSVFVQIDLPPNQRRYALARETLSALITSRHGRALGLADMLLNDLRESSEYFARWLLAPGSLVRSYFAQGGTSRGFSAEFGLPGAVGVKHLDEVSSVIA